MIRKDNERLTITLTKKQVQWLRKNAKRLNMPVSKFIKWMLDKNLAIIMRQNYDNQELRQIQRIASTPWIITFNEYEEPQILTKKMKKTRMEEIKRFHFDDEAEEVDEDDLPF